MNFANNKMKINLFVETRNIIRKRWWLKGIKSKQQYWVGDIFTNKMDRQYNQFQQKLKKKNREIHYK